MTAEPEVTSIVSACSHGYPDNGPAALDDEVTPKAVVAWLTDRERHKYWRVRLK